MKQNRLFKTTFIALTMLVLTCKCSVHKSINIRPERKSDELTFYLDPTAKRASFGITLLASLNINLEIPELIQNLKVYDSDERLIWEIKALNSEKGGHGVKYGQVNQREYSQLFPQEGSPESLKTGKLYTIILKTSKASYKRQFVLNIADIKITDRDKVEL